MEKEREIGDLQRRIQEQEKSIIMLRGKGGAEGNKGKPETEETKDRATSGPRRGEEEKASYTKRLGEVHITDT